MYEIVIVTIKGNRNKLQLKILFIPILFVTKC